MGRPMRCRPRSRNSVDWQVNVNTQRCSNVTEGSNGKCENGQASFWYSQGCFIGCPTCDNESGRRQTDLCGLGKKQTLTDVKYWSVNRDAVPFSEDDIYQVCHKSARSRPTQLQLQLQPLSPCVAAAQPLACTRFGSRGGRLRPCWRIAIPLERRRSWRL